MEALFVFIFYLGIPLGLLFVGWLAGSIAEKKHYESIHLREKKFAAIPAISTKTPPERNYLNARLVSGSCVVSVDYFKKFLAALRFFFGGEVVAYSSLIDRGRREALLRMKEQAVNADLFLNIRLETSTISSGGKKKQTGAIEVLAYGTALRFKEDG